MIETATKYDVWELMALAESVNPPNDHPDYYTDVEFEAREGWKVSIFYDVGELDYIAHFVTPDGEVLDFWEWPEGRDRDLLIAWRGVGDLARLRALRDQESVVFADARVGDQVRVKYEPGLEDRAYLVLEVDADRPGNWLRVQGLDGPTWVANENVTYRWPQEGQTE
jgi:hypothetical protein